MSMLNAGVRNVVHMTAQTIGVVVVDADPGQRRVLAGLITDKTDGRFTATAFASREEALAALADRRDAILLADLATIGGASELPKIARSGHRLIATSEQGSLSTAIAAMRAGAIDFLPKPIGARALIERLEAAVEAWRPAVTPEPAATFAAKPAAAPGANFAGFVGNSPAMRAVYDQIARMAPSRAPVFVTGESGTGKELCAEAIHAHSGRAGGAFIAINCSAIPRDLMESEIFGHVRGAFTGAIDDRTGAAELADGGTLFLDEIGEMDLGLQAKILRFVQSGTLQRVGSTETKRVDVRIVCATNRDPFAEAEAGRFRADLLYRLHVLPIHLPPLRERGDDILPLAEYLLTASAAEEGRAIDGFDAGSRALLLSHDWPGNVRELANTIRRAVVLGEGSEISVDALPIALRRGAGTGVRPATAGAPAPTIEPFSLQERRIIEYALATFGGNISRAAAALQINPSTIYRKRQSWSEAEAVPERLSA